jgi:hypothetical protein
MSQPFGDSEDELGGYVDVPLDDHSTQQTQTLVSGVGSDASVPEPIGANHGVSTTIIEQILNDPQMDEPLVDSDDEVDPQPPKGQASQRAPGSQCATTTGGCGGFTSTETDPFPVRNSQQMAERLVITLSPNGQSGSCRRKNFVPQKTVVCIDLSADLRTFCKLFETPFALNDSQRQRAQRKRSRRRGSRELASRPQVASKWASNHDSVFRWPRSPPKDVVLRRRHPNLRQTDPILMATAIDRVRQPFATSASTRRTLTS